MVVEVLSLFGGLVLAVLIAAVLAARTARRPVTRRILWAGLAGFAAAWIPLLTALTGWAGDNPVGLGLLAWMGSGLAILVMGAGLILRLWEFITSA